MAAVLVDAGPLVALIDRTDSWHLRCRDALREITDPLVTVWPALTEASYLLRRWERAQSALLQLIEGGAIGFAAIEAADVPRIRELMWKYRDLPMDLADAALVRVAERDRLDRIFTIDQGDFSLYRPARIGRFRVLP